MSETYTNITFDIVSAASCPVNLQRAKRDGDAEAFRVLQIFLGSWICQLWGAWLVFVPAAVLMAAMYLATK